MEVKRIVGEEQLRRLTVEDGKKVRHIQDTVVPALKSNQNGQEVADHFEELLGVLYRALRG